MRAVTVRGLDLDLKYDGNTQRIQNQSEWNISCDQSGILAYELKNSKTIKTKLALEISSPSGFLTFDHVKIRESLFIHFNSKTKSCETANHVDIEKYLQGVINSEFSTKWAKASIDAQAIAARTYALYQIRDAKKRHQNYDVDLNTKDQVYGGFLVEDGLAARSVVRTEGLILTPRMNPNQPAKTFYHSTCGGLTDLPQEVWGKKQAGFNQTVICPYCVTSPRYHWTTQVTEVELKNLVKIERGIASLHIDLREIRLGNIDGSGRLKNVNFILSNQTGVLNSKIISAVELRNKLGTTRIKSTHFSVVPLANGVWEFRGIGNGHGVGLCQWGAKVMGEKGFKTNEILSHYYPDLVLKKFW